MADSGADLMASGRTRNATMTAPEAEMTSWTHNATNATLRYKAGIRPWWLSGKVKLESIDSLSTKRHALTSVFQT